MANIELDLRHMTSTGHLSSQRSPHRHSHLVRPGSRSPNSIPSSPTSVHSSSSAIFERDIEPVVSPFQTHPNPHRIPRAKGTEQLEHSVPSVLDSAASVLATLEDTGDTVDHVAVVAPASAGGATSTTSPNAAFESILARSTNSGFASPIGSFRSRSPSPLGLRVATGPGPMPRTDLLLNIPTIAASPQVVSGGITAMSSPSQSVGVPSPPAPSTTLPLPSRPTNTAAAAVGTSPNPNTAMATPPLPAIVTPPATSVESGESSPTACEHPSAQGVSASQLPHPISALPMTSPPPQQQLQQFASPTSWTSTLSHPPSPTHAPTKRLSFMSYSDLLSSTPASTLPLSSLTTSASSMEPPPHIPSVSGLNLANAAHTHAHAQLPPNTGGVMTNSATTSLRGFVIGPMGGITHAGKRDSIAMLDDVGGEWEREGLGRGLEERLEALIVPPMVVTRT